MMEGTTASLCLFLLVNQLPFCPADAEGERSNMQWLAQTANQSSGSIMEPNQTTNDHTNVFDMDNNSTRIDCLIDTEMGLIAIGSAGGLIVCLLVTIVVLACQICQIQRRVYAPRTSRSNMCLVGETTGYWGSDNPEAGGLVGPCETSVMLEEVREESRMEEEECQGEIQAAEEGTAAEREDGATAMVFDLEEKDSHMMSSSSRDSCLEVPRDLENMPLVV